MAAPDGRNSRAVRNLVGKPIKCTLDDGRTATGIFVCVDRLKNIILSQVVEERKVDSLVYNPDVESRTLSAKRTLGQAMIPGPRLVKVEVSKKIYESCVTTTISDSQTNE